MCTHILDYINYKYSYLDISVMHSDDIYIIKPVLEIKQWKINGDIETIETI